MEVNKTRKGEPPKSLQCLVVGFGIGAIVAITIGFWNGMPMVYRISAVGLIGLSTLMAWILAEFNNKYTNYSKHYSADCEGHITKTKSRDESNKSSNYGQNNTKPFHK